MQVRARESEQEQDAVERSPSGHIKRGAEVISIALTHLVLMIQCCRVFWEEDQHEPGEAGAGTTWRRDRPRR